MIFRPNNRTLPAVLRPNLGSEISNRKEILNERWVPRNSFDGSEMAVDLKVSFLSFKFPVISPFSPPTRILIFSVGDLPFRLQLKSIPCSVPHINRVGIVVSYSRTDTPYDLTWSSVRVGSIIKRSMGLRLRMSHHIRPSDDPEKNSDPLFELIHSTEVTGSPWLTSFSLFWTGVGPDRVS